jgi:hypothetical protein
VIELTLDVERYDRPFIDATDRTDVPFLAVHRELDERAAASEELE